MMFHSTLSYVLYLCSDNFLPNQEVLKHLLEMRNYSVNYSKVVSAFYNTVVVIKHEHGTGAGRNIVTITA